MALIERSSSLAELHGLLHQAAAGQGHLVFLGGEAGVGKTSLVRHFQATVSPDTRVLTGACDPLSTPRPLGPLLDIAEEVGGKLGHLANEAIPRHRLFSAFLGELDRGPTPTLAVIEDLHWADEASLDLLRFLGKRLGSTHGLLIATYRNDEVGPNHPLQLVIGDLATSTSVHRIALSPLSVAGVRALAADRDLDPVSLHRQTGGNPFFVTEVLATGEIGIPPNVRDAVLSRAARLSRGARAALDAAAVIGSPIEPWLLRGMPDVNTRAVEECLASGMLVVANADLAFRHELAREAVLDAVFLPRRLELHAQVLAALQSSGTPNFARLAHHAEEARNRDGVLAYAPLAAERAAAVRAHREAAAQYARALRFAGELPLEERGSLLIAHAQECYLTDQVGEGIEACQAALALWRRVGDRLQEGDSLRRLSRLYWLAGKREEAESTAWKALSILEALPPGPHLAMAYSAISQLFVLSWDAEKAIAWGQKAKAMAERFGETETLVHALNNVGTALMGTGQATGHELVERSMRLALDADLEEHAARSLSNLGLSLVVRYQFAEADRFLRQGIAYCSERDLDQQGLYTRSWYALSLFHQSRWNEAVEAAATVERQPRVSLISRIMALVALGRVRTRQGDPEAGAILDAAFALAEQTGELQRLGPVRVAQIEASWLAGDTDRVLTTAREALDLVTRHNHQWLVGELAFWLWRVGDLDVLPPGVIEPFALQIAGNWRGAAAAWEALGCPYEAAWALADGDEAALRDAHAAFVQLGALPAAARVVRRLRALGADAIPRGPRPATRANPVHLTPREMEVLALVADGLPNTRIAERLYLSPRTVGHHVSAILEKLGVTSRREAGQAARRLGIAGQSGQEPGPK